MPQPHPGIRRARWILRVTITLVVLGVGTAVAMTVADELDDTKCIRYDVADLVGEGRAYANPDTLIAAVRDEFGPAGRDLLLFEVHAASERTAISVVGNWFTQRRVLAVLDEHAAPGVERATF